MATQYAFGKIVTDGLVLALDAADKNSYPGSGTTWRDLTNNGYNGTLTNGPTFSSANGGSIVFDGVDDFVNCPISWTPTSFSIYWFLYPLTRSNFNQQISTTSGWGTFVFHTTSDGSVYVGTDLTNRLTPTNIGPNTVVLNIYQQFCFTYTSNTGSFYKNGTLLATKTGLVNSTAWTNFRMGAVSSDATNGRIPIMHIYNRALTASEVAQNYNAQKSRFNL
jgi:hypothetical protein